MPQMSGFDFLDTFDNNTQVIVISGAKKYALASYNYSNVTDYLYKPISYDRFNKSINRFLERFIEGHSCCRLEHVFVQNEDVYHKISLSDVIYMNMKTKESVFFTSDGSYVCKHVKNLECVINNSNFVRINSDTWVNINKTHSLNDNHKCLSVLLDDELKDIQVDEEFKANLLKSLNYLNK